MPSFSQSFGSVTATDEMPLTEWRPTTQTPTSTVLFLTFVLVMLAEGDAFPRHSQAFLAKRAAASAAAAAARNQTYIPRVPKAQAKTAVPLPAQLRAGGKQDCMVSTTRSYPSGITSVFKSMRRDEEEAADARFATLPWPCCLHNTTHRQNTHSHTSITRTHSAPALPADLLAEFKTCSTRYGTMAYRVIHSRPVEATTSHGRDVSIQHHRAQSLPDASLPACGLDVVFLHGLGTLARVFVECMRCIGSSSLS